MWKSRYGERSPPEGNQRKRKTKDFVNHFRTVVVSKYKGKISEKSEKNGKTTKKVNFVTLIEKIDNEARKQFLRLASVHL